MVAAATAGITPLDFYRMTVGEVSIAISGYNERERSSVIARVSEILRALRRNGDPYEGLKIASNAAANTTSWARNAVNWLWDDKE